ncbi:MAG: polysaccharide pyruvyl transferase family protein [Planctomycetota bacterium]
MNAQPTPSKRIHLHGCYHTGNFGDLLLLDLLARHVNRTHHQRPTDLFPPVEDHHHFGVETVDIGKGPRTAFSTDVAVLGGGGYLVASESKSAIRRLLRYSVPAHIWQLRGVPYAVVGVGAGPSLAGAAPRRIRRILKGATAICPRDQESADLLASIGVDRDRMEVTADIVMSLTPDQIPAGIDDATDEQVQRESDRKRIAMHLPLRGSHPDAYQRILELVGDELRGRDDVEVYWLFDHGFDGNDDTIRQFHNEHHIPGGKIIAERHIWKFVELLRRFNMVITSKLHVGIVSWAMGTPTCGLSAHGKTRRFYRQIGRLDFQQNLDEDLDKVRTWVRMLLDDDPQLASEDVDARVELPRLARRNFEVADEVIRSVG